MPIDPNIALGYRGIEVPNPLASMAQVTQIQTAQRQGEMAQMQLEELKRDREEMLQFQKAWAAKGGNPDLNALADMMIKSPKMMAKGIELKQKLQEQAQFDSLLKQTFGGAAPATAPAAAPAAAGPTPIMSRLPEGSLGSAVPGAVSPAVAFAQPPRIVRTIEGANTPDNEPVFAPRSENALAPSSPPVNAMAAAQPTPIAPANQLAAPGQRSPEELRSLIAAWSQSRDPRAKSIIDMLQSELTEAGKTHNVAPGTQVMRNGKVVYTAPESATTTQREYDQAVRQGFKGSLLDYKRQVAEAGRPITNVEIKQEAALGQALGTQQAKAIAEGRDAATSAVTMLDTINTGRKLLNSGMVTGAGADFLVSLNQGLKTLGIDAGKADAAANSQAFAATMASSVGQLIKQFGAGTGLSNADRDYAEKMAGGKITLDESAIRKILDINERAARNVIAAHNKSVDKAGKQAEWFRVDMPAIESAPSPAPAAPTSPTAAPAGRIKFLGIE